MTSLPLHGRRLLRRDPPRTDAHRSHTRWCVSPARRPFRWPRRRPRRASRTHTSRPFPAHRGSPIAPHPDDGMKGKKHIPEQYPPESEKISATRAPEKNPNPPRITFRLWRWYQIAESPKPFHLSRCCSRDRRHLELHDPNPCTNFLHVPLRAIKAAGAAPVQRLCSLVHSRLQSPTRRRSLTLIFVLKINLQLHHQPTRS